MAALMPRLFGDVTDWFESEFPLRTGHMIRIEDFLTDHEYVVRAELPGLDPEKGIQVTLNQGVLTVSAERREEEQTRTRSEFRYGMFHRSVRLPANADTEKITARYTNGVLEVRVPLTAPEQTGRQIPVAKEE
jgi:HSP20 family molecular chaperone IbpA